MYVHAHTYVRTELFPLVMSRKGTMGDRNKYMGGQKGTRQRPRIAPKRTIVTSHVSGSRWEPTQILTIHYNVLEGGGERVSFCH